MTPRSRTGTTALLLAATVAAVLAACATSPVDKQGAPVAAVTELVVGAADPTDAELVFFVGAVDRASNHRVKIRVDPTTYESETPGGEAKLAGAVHDGTVQLGYIPSRDLAQGGAAAFQALHVPFLVGPTPAAVAFAGTPLAQDVLASLGDRGMHGIALVPRESRVLLSRRPVVDAVQLTGLRVRVNDNAQTAGLMSAWSATPVQGYTAGKTRSELTAGRLDAVETSPAYILPNAYFSPAPYLGSFSMIPKFEVIVAGTKVWSGLSDADRSALTTAANLTLEDAAARTVKGESEVLSRLCTRGVVVVRPSDDALKTLTAAAATSVPDAAPVQAWVARLRTVLAGQRTPPAPVPSGCPVATTAAQATALHDKAVGSTTAAAGPAKTAFPTGTFTVLVTRADWKAGGVDNDLSTADITFTWTFRPDGTFLETQVPDFPDQGPFEGTYTVDGDHLTITGRFKVDPATLYVETTAWSYFRGELHLVVVDVADDAGKVVYSKPWRKTG